VAINIATNDIEKLLKKKEIIQFNKTNTILKWFYRHKLPDPSSLPAFYCFHHFSPLHTLLDARLFEHSNSNPNVHLLLSSSYLSLCSSSFFLLQKWKLTVREIFERGGKEANARAGCGQAGELDSGGYTSPTFWLLGKIAMHFRELLW
jgi:hypothetical protein